MYSSESLSLITAINSELVGFTSRVCPALCEAACTCGLHAEPVSTKENEKAVIEYAFEHGLVKEEEASYVVGNSGGRLYPAGISGECPLDYPECAQRYRAAHQ